MTTKIASVIMVIRSLLQKTMEGGKSMIKFGAWDGFDSAEGRVHSMWRGVGPVYALVAEASDACSQQCCCFFHR